MFRIPLCFFLLVAAFCPTFAQSAPANDDLANATVLPGEAFVLMEDQTNVDASLEPGETTAPFNRRRKTVWYSWSPPTSGTYVFKITDTNFDAIIGVLPDDVFNYTQRSGSRLVFTAKQGITHSLSVGGFTGELNDQGDFSFTLSPAPLSRADLQRAVFSPDPVTSPGTSTLTLDIYTENGFSAGELTIRTAGGRLLSVVEFDEDERVSVDGNVGTYEVDVAIPANLDGQSLVVDCMIRSIDGYTATFGDGYSGSHPQQGLVDLTMEVTTPAIVDSQAPTLTSIAASSTILNVSGNREVTFDLAVTDDLSGFRDGSFFVLSATALATPTYNGSRIAAEYPFSMISSGTPQNAMITTSVDFDLPVGDYFVYVTLNDIATNRRTLAAASLPGPFAGTISVISPGAPVNDPYASATTLGGSTFGIAGDNTNASLEFGELDDLHSASVWYSWVAPTTGTFQIDTFGSSFDTVLGVFQGANILTSELIRQNDDTGEGLQSLVQFEAAAGQTYYIGVGGFGDDDFGTFSLNGEYVVPTSPVLTSIVLNPPTADVSDGPQSISIDLGISAPNTLDDSYIDIIDNQGNYVTTVDFGGESTLTNGTVNVMLPIPEGIAPLPLRVETSLWDQSNHRTDYGSDFLPYPSSFSGLIPVVNNGTVDLEYPWFVSHGISPSPVDVTAAAQTVTVTFTVGDDTGIDGARVDIYDQNGSWIVEKEATAGDIVSSNGRNTTYAVDLEIPQFSAAGVDWQYEISAYDAYDKDAYESGEFEVISPELSAPQITSVSVTPDPVPLNGVSDATPQLDIAFTDDASGLEYLYVEIRDPGNQFVASQYFETGDLETGDALGGTFQTTFTLPKTSPSGTYTISTDAGDVAGQGAFDGSAGTFEVTNLEMAAPVITSATVTPSTVLVDGINAAMAQLDIAFTDDGSGIDQLVVDIRNPSDVSIAMHTFATGDILTGTATDGTFQTMFSVPGTAASGTYTIITDARDAFGREANGVSSGTFSVNNTEVAAPVITSATVTPSTVTVDGLNAAMAQLDIAFTDDGSGIDQLVVDIRNPSDASIAMQTFAASDIQTGTATDGTFQTTFSVPGTSPTGTYSIVTSTRDAVGREANGVTSGSFMVNNTEVAAPVVTQVNASPDPVVVDGLSSTDTTIRLDFTDDGSGIDTLHVEIQNTAGDVITSKDFTAADIASGGSATAGYFESDFTIPGLTPDGLYRIVTDTRDVAGRERNDVDSGTVQVTNTDVAAPTIDGFTVIPAHVYFDGDNDNDAQLEITFSDDGSGIDTLQIEIRDANGTTADTIDLTSADITTGTGTGGTFLMTFTVPGGATPGTFTIHATATDRMGRTSSDISVGSFPVSIEASPQIIGFTVTPSPVDVNDATASATLQIDFTDDNSGLTTMQVQITAPDGNSVAVIDLTTADIISGDALSGRIETSFQIGKFAPAGDYTITATVRDVSGVQANNIAVGTFPVTNSGAVSPALDALQTLSIAPASIDVSSASESVTVSVGLSDNTGIQTVRALVYRPDGRLFFEGDAANTPETPLVYTRDFNFSVYSMPGEWHVDLVITDDNDNELLYSNTTMNGGTFADTHLPFSMDPLVDNRFTVVNNGTPDVDDPILSGLWFAPGTVDTHYQAQVVRVNVAWDDDNSGFDHIEIDAFSPNGTLVASVSLYPNFDGVLGNNNLGAAAKTMTIPQGTEPGELRFEVSLYDFAGNLSFFDNAFPPGSFQGLTVTSRPDFDRWLDQFPSLTDTSPDGDPDGDGLSTFLEFLLDLDPTNPNDAGAPRLRIENGNLQLVYQPGPDSANALMTTGYHIDGQISGDLKIWNHIPVEDLGGGFSGLSIPLGAESQRYLRLISQRANG